MVLVKSILVRTLVILISFSFINGGGSILPGGNDISILVGHNHPGDIESDHHHNILTSHDEEKILESSFFDFSYKDNDSVKFFNISTISTRDYSGSIWQPPRFS